jgi:hypothetical protein
MNLFACQTEGVVFCELPGLQATPQGVSKRLLENVANRNENVTRVKC